MVMAMLQMTRVSWWLTLCLLLSHCHVSVSVAGPSWVNKSVESCPGEGISSTYVSVDKVPGPSSANVTASGPSSVAKSVPCPSSTGVIETLPVSTVTTNIKTKLDSVQGELPHHLHVLHPPWHHPWPCPMLLRLWWEDFRVHPLIFHSNKAGN